MSKATKKTKSTAVTTETPPATSRKFKKCVARDKGHRSCHCGRGGCGELATGG